MGRDVHEGREGGRAGRPYLARGGLRFVPGEWYPVLCSRFLVQPVLLSSTDIRTFGFDELWFEGAFPPIPLSVDIGAVARAAPICETTDTAVIHLPSGFRDSLTFLPNRSLRLGDRGPSEPMPSKKLKIVPIR